MIFDEVWIKAKQGLKYLLYAFLAACVVFTVYTAIQKYREVNAAPEKTTVEMPYSDTTNSSAVKEALGTDSQETKEIVREIQYIHDGATAPEVTYYVTAPTLEDAATKTIAQIRANNAAIPDTATEKTDKTIVTANMEQQKVDVYKINLRNNHKVKAGVLAVKEHVYPAVGYQTGRFDVAVATDGRKVKGGYVMYTVAQW